MALFDSFRKFMLNKDLLNLVIAVYLGAVLQDFFTSVVDGALLPILLRFFPGSKYTHYEDIVVQYGETSIKLGQILMNSIKLMIGFSLVFYSVKYFVNEK